MTATALAPSLASELRGRFAAAMSRMYRHEVPAYGTLLQIVGDINRQTLAEDPALANELKRNDNLARLDEERHGAIRLGSADELATMRRFFAIMGMFPVGYYDLSIAGLPVHSTAFRPLTAAALAQNPFRIFTSLLRPELIKQESLRAETAALLGRRRIFTPAALALLQQAEGSGRLNDRQADSFISELLETFRWHRDARVSRPLYDHLHEQHPLIADIVSFKGPHINHLTPRTLNIDRVQQEMPRHAITPKAVIEGPPPRRCPILLRQTSFRALTENITFSDRQDGKHTARFGEVEQRGAALTRGGRQLYDQLLLQTRRAIPPAADGSNAAAYIARLGETFNAFPDEWSALLTQQLAYFKFTLTGSSRAVPAAPSPSALLDAGLVECAPITYEDFLPVSAAGIFQSNLGDHAASDAHHSAARHEFEQALGQPVINAFHLYEKIQAESLAQCRRQLGIPS